MKNMKNEVELKNIKIKDSFWCKYMELVKKEIIPYQWKVLNDSANIRIEKERDDNNIPSEKSHAIENFKIAAGLKSGHHYGYVFQDSDVYKWLEAVSYSLINEKADNLEKVADDVIDLIELAQEEDGYLDTYFTIDAPERKFKRLLESHELYCAGHFMEAAVAYYEATGKKKVIDIACKVADCIDRNFGPEESKIHGYDGHEEVEIGLAKLYSATENENYLKLSKYFLEQRGKESGFLRNQLAEDNNKNAILPVMNNFSTRYFQVHKPILEQETAEGHSVRLVYMCTALADVAYLTKNKEMLDTCKRLWKNITEKRMYITGGIGSTVNGEAFTFDYDLPNDTMYCETCASIGLIFFAHSMLKSEPSSIYADVLERSLYNSSISGMALDGKHFFYVNPLEVDPKASKYDPTKSHVKTTRAEWFGCACCPPNLARTLTSLGKYVYTTFENTIYTHLYLSNDAEVSINNNKVSIKQETNLPWEGNVKVSVGVNKKSDFGMAFRIPYWCDSYSVKVNGEAIDYEVSKGYISINREWNNLDVIEIQLEMKIQEISANPHIKDDLGKVALQRGPLIYCLEEVDNGKNLHHIKLNNREYKYDFDPNLLGGVVKITTKAKKLIIDNSWEDKLYKSNVESPNYEDKEIIFIPYYSWANRNQGEMKVWINK
ncbi:glycoside hydrolase family 127 protein [Clostridium sp. SHJSY1]|uniref:glycoside hydrolase family 127 protein n=1 Tax=Clostridium sp. SHJSY1 TaxID=2942483 RepID=UPI0028761F61|nr:beta-L-arabinofuranosidase domain-containing protein [Clostridium sp. SHJSY1]MDS0528301.1 glycoside hydrolase family 127 protein [Clostridium sp. SHJSY1]